MTQQMWQMTFAKEVTVAQYARMSALCGHAHALKRFATIRGRIVKTFLPKLFVSLVSLFLLQCLSCSAATYVFADIPWDSNQAKASAILSAKGFKTLPVDKEGDVPFSGTLLGHRALGVAFFADGKLVKVSVGILTRGEKARAIYRELQETLVQKYGAPTDMFEEFESPFSKGDGLEDTAIKSGKATIATGWEGPNEGGLLLDINKEMIVRVIYEGPAWLAEMRNRKAQSKSVF
jgi:hypothetical protein